MEPSGRVTVVVPVSGLIVWVEPSGNSVTTLPPASRCVTLPPGLDSRSPVLSGPEMTEPSGRVMVEEWVSGSIVTLEPSG